MVTAGLQLHAQPGIRGSWVAPLLTPRPLSCPCTLPVQRAISLINRGHILFLFLCSPVQSFCYCFVNLLKTPNFLLEYSRTKYVPEFSTVRFNRVRGGIDHILLGSLEGALEQCMKVTLHQGEKEILKIALPRKGQGSLLHEFCRNLTYKHSLTL